ncbi:hypothetical protein PMAYCL1PPCAC_08181, partial [Pristionchus mayeri]
CSDSIFCTIISSCFSISLSIDSNVFSNRANSALSSSSFNRCPAFPFVIAESRSGQNHTVLVPVHHLCQRKWTHLIASRVLPIPHVCFWRCTAILHDAQGRLPLFAL